MRSVLHQTKARAAKLEAASGTSSAVSSSDPSGSTSNSTSTPSPIPATNSTTNSSNSSSSPAGAQKIQSNMGSNNLSSHSHNVENMGNSACQPSPSENHEVKKKKFADMLSSRGHQQQLQHQQQQLAQAPSTAQAQLQQEFQQAAFLQSQFFNPLLQHFPMTADTLLPLSNNSSSSSFTFLGQNFN